MSTDVAPEAAPEAASDQENQAQSELDEQKELLDKIVPNRETRTWVVGQGDDQMTLTQKPMSYFAKIEWFGLLGDTLNRAAQYGNLNLSTILASPERREGILSMTDIQDAETFLQIILRLVANAPDFLLESYCIWLAIPRGSRTYAKSIMSLPAEEGGFSDEDGIGVVQTFLDQNIETLRDFITKRVPSLGRRAIGLMQQESLATK